MKWAWARLRAVCRRTPRPYLGRRALRYHHCVVTMFAYYKDVYVRETSLAVTPVNHGGPASGLAEIARYTRKLLRSCWH